MNFFWVDLQETFFLLLGPCVAWQLILFTAFGICLAIYRAVQKFIVERR